MDETTTPRLEPLIRSILYKQWCSAPVLPQNGNVTVGAFLHDEQ
jgi:hypothetical protein